MNEVIGICSRCGWEFTRADEDREVPGLAYCAECGHAMSYDR